MDYLQKHLSDDTIEDLKLLVLSFVIWNIVNLVVMYAKIPDSHLPRNEMLDLRNRIVSCLHGTVSMFLAAYNTYFLHSECGQKNTKFEEHIMIISCGYFFYDFMVMIYFNLMDRSMFVHHFICMIGMAYCVISDFSAHVLIAALFVSEISNPAMHVRVVLKHLNKRYTKAYESCELMYIILYIFGRMILGLPILYGLWMCEHDSLFQKILGTGLIVQSMYFISKMGQILRSRAAEYSERKKKGVKMLWFQELSKEQISKIDLYNRKTSKPKIP
eukprot:403363195